MSHHDLVLIGRVGVAFGLAFVFGFERQLRGSPAGDRTFALVGTTAAAVTAVAGLRSPQAIAGLITGLGFIGAGVVFHQQGLVKGLTTAAALFAIAGIGIVVGYGDLWLGVITAVILLFTLELQHIPFLKFLDGQNFASRFQDDRVVQVPADGPRRPAPATERPRADPQG